MSGLNFPNVGRLNLKNSADGVHFFGMASLSSVATPNTLMIWNNHATKPLRLASALLISSLAGQSVLLYRVAATTGFTLLQGAENKNLGTVSADVLSYYRTSTIGTVLNGSTSLALGVNANQHINFPIAIGMPINIPALSGLIFAHGSNTATFTLLYEAFYDN